MQDRKRVVKVAADIATKPPVRHLHQIELANRWRVSHRTLERWRWQGKDPAYLKIGGRVAYRLDDVEVYEAARRRDVAAAADPKARAIG
jgi:hypothetical protein